MREEMRAPVPSILAFARCFFCETPKRISDDRAARGKYCMYEGASMAIAGQTVAPRSDLHDEIERMLSHKSSK